MAFIHLRADKKHRLQIPSQWAEEYGIEGEVLAEKKPDSIVVYRQKKVADPIKHLAELGRKLKGLKGKTPLQLKKLGQRAMAEEAVKGF